MSAPTSEVLNRAADLIEERGHGYGAEAMHGGAEGLCLMGAINAASFGKFDNDYPAATYCPAGVAVYDYLNLSQGDSGAGWRWNDAFTLSPFRRLRTATEVIEVLRAAAAIEQAREADDTRTIEPLDANGRGTGECELTAQGVAECHLQPGDLCQLLGNYMVRHVSCDEHRDGVVTDVRTGRVLSEREVALAVTP